MRALRWAWRTLLALLLLPILLVAIVFGLLQTGFGQRQAASLIEGLATTPDMQVEIGGIDGFVPFDMTVTDLALADEDGVWATVDRARLAWSPSALFDGVLRIDALTAGRVVVERLPPPAEEPAEPEPSEPFDPSAIGLPELPLGVRLDRLRVDEIVLGDAVLGTPARLALQGEARLVEAAEGLAVELLVERTDATRGRVALQAAFTPDNRLAVDLDISEPPGGMLASLLGLAEEPAVDIALEGEGPLADWGGTLRIDAGEGFDGTAELGIERTADGGYALALAGGFDVTALMPPELDPLLEGGLTLDAHAVAAPDGAVEIEEIEAAAAAGTVRLAGTLGPGFETADLSFEVEAGNPAAFAGLISEADWRSLRLGGTVAGPLAAPTVSLDVDAEGVAVAGAGVGSLDASARLEGPPGSPEAAALSLDATDVAAPGGYGAATLTLDAEGRIGADGLDADAELAASTVAGPDLAIRQVMLNLDAAGPVDAPVLDASLVAESVAAMGIGTERFTLTLETAPQGDLDDPDLTLAVTARASAETFAMGDPALDELLTPEIGLAVDGIVGRDGSIVVDRAALDLPALSLAASGRAENWGETAAVSAELRAPRLSAFADLAGMPLSGALTLDIEAAREDGTVDADIDALLAGLQTGIAQLDNALGERTTFALEATAREDGAFRVAELSLDAAALSLTGEDLHLTEAEAGGSLTLTVPELSAIDPAYAGAVRLAADLSGSLERPAVDAVLTAENLEAAGIAVPQARLSVDARDLADTPQGNLDLTGEVASLPVDVSLAFALGEDTLAIDDLSADIASAALAGDLTVGFDGMASGTLTGSVDALSDFAELAGQPLSGSARLDLALSSGDGQSADATLQLANFSLPGTANVAAATLQADVADALAEPRLDASLTARGVSAGGIDLDRIEAGAQGGMDSLAVTLDASGPQISLAAAADLGLAGETTRIGLSRLTAGYEGETVSLAQPATITLAPSGIAIDRLALTARGGRVVLAGRYGESDLDLTLEIADLPLGLAGVAAPDLDLTGTLGGRVALSGSLANPSGRFDLRAGDVGLAEARALGFSGLDATASGNWTGQRLDLQAQVRSPDVGRIAMTGALPLVMGAGGVPAVPETAQVAANLDGRIDLAAANTLLAAGGSRVTGQALVDVAIGGTLADLRPDGTVRLQGVSYTDPVYGIALTGIDATLTGTGERFELTRLSGTTPGGGSIGGSGTVDLDPDAPNSIDLSLTMDDANLINSELFTGTFDADLALDGTFDRALLAGTVTIERAVLRIPESLPSSVPTLDVEVVNAPPEIAARYEDAEEPAAGGDGEAAFDLRLDITVRAPQEVYVRGRGLDVEVGGRIAVEGTAASPRLQGGLSLRRGGLDLLGQQFTFDQAEVRFTGGRDINPRLDFLAETETEDLTVRIGLTGPASSPNLELSSEPEVPQDEILSRLLFGRSSGQLSAVQAIQLADSAATLAGLGASGGFLSSVRNALGVDRLEITGGEGGEEVAVEAGRYVGEGVYVGVEQGLEQGSSEVTVEVEITDNITVETDVGSDASGRVGVNFQWDY